MVGVRDQPVIVRHHEDGGTALGNTADHTSGAVHGGISSKQIHDTLVPSVAKLLQAAVMLGPNAALLLAYFDVNGDGTISADEVESNATVRTLLPTSSPVSHRKVSNCSTAARSPSDSAEGITDGF